MGPLSSDEMERKCSVLQSCSASLISLTCCSHLSGSPRGLLQFIRVAALGTRRKQLDCSISLLCIISAGTLTLFHCLLTSPLIPLTISSIHCPVLQLYSRVDRLHQVHPVLRHKRRHPPFFANALQFVKSVLRSVLRFSVRGYQRRSHSLSHL